MNWRHFGLAGLVLIAVFLFLSTPHAQSFASDDNYANERSYQPPPPYQPKPFEPSPGDRITTVDTPAPLQPAAWRDSGRQNRDGFDFRDTVGNSSLAPFSESADDAGDATADNPS